MKNLDLRELSQGTEVVAETPKAIQIQVWFGSGSDPKENARCYWLPKSQTTVVNGIVSVARWLIAQHRLWDA